MKSFTSGNDKSTPKRELTARWSTLLLSTIVANCCLTVGQSFAGDNSYSQSKLVVEFTICPTGDESKPYELKKLDMRIDSTDRETGTVTKGKTAQGLTPAGQKGSEFEVTGKFFGYPVVAVIRPDSSDPCKGSVEFKKLFGNYEDLGKDKWTQQYPAEEK